MRVGQNPGKFVSEVATPERITVAIVSYVPALVGYFEQGLEILRACLDSVAENTRLPHDLMVFDNGSCPEVRDFLTERLSAGRIQYLLLSARNLGKGGAWNYIFSSGPGEIIAYADSDVHFRPGWLEQTLELLEALPRAGMITSRPLRTDLALCQATIDWAERSGEATIERGRFIPWEVFSEFDRSLGQSEQQMQERYQTTEDLRLSYQSLRAYVGASHFQFVARRELLAELFPIAMDRPMGEVRTLDRLVDQAGLLRLCTTEALVTHMGNRLVAPEAYRSRPRPARGLARRMANIPLVRRALLSIYDRIFRWYFVKP